MSKTYGKTWWGNSWLKSLDHIDYENRIPRGAAYAKSRKVKSIKINQNVVTARVKGSRVRPYNVTIIVPPFIEKDIERLINEIETRPALISKLMNRELDSEMLNIALNLGLNVFPRQWSDFKMQCDCPDWAVPCKHLAATIYILSQEIDNNPFLVFEMHRVNLSDELKKRNITIDAQGPIDCKSAQDLMVRRKLGKGYVYDSSAAYQKIDLTTIRPLAASLVQMLPDEPPFYNNGNFREIYERQFFKVIKQMQRLFSKDLNGGALIPRSTIKPIGKRTSLSIQLHKDMSWKITHHALSNEHFLKTFYDQGELINALYKLDPENIENVQPCIASLYNVLNVSIQLLANGAVVPQLLHLSKNEFKIRWLPAQMDEQVRSIIKQLDESLAPNLLVFIPKGLKLEAPIQSQAEWMVSIFLNDLIKSFSEGVKEDEELLSLFFRNKIIDFSGVGDTAKSGAIKVWLDMYSLSNTPYCPVLLVKEQPDYTGFGLNISFELENQGDYNQVPLSDILTQQIYTEKRYQILRELSLLAHFIPGLDKHINQQGEGEIFFPNATFAPFLLEMIPAIRMLNIKVMLPKSLADLLRPQVSLKVKRKESDGKAFIRLNDLLAFDWQIALGDKMLSLEAFNKIADKAMGLIRYKGSYVYFNEADTERLYHIITHDKPLSGTELLKAALSGEYEESAITLTEEVRKLIRDLTSDQPVALPQSLIANLRPYQERGFSWLYRNMQIGFGSILADDMGLGKTLQVIAFLLKLRDEGLLNIKERALIVVPTGLLTNWQMEVNKFAPTLSMFQYYGPGRSMKGFDHDVMITSYGTLRSDSALLKKTKWKVLIIDEAQNIKNHDTAQSKAIKDIPADIHIAMSGTPVENRLTEFWSIMDFANKGYLGTIKHFKETFAKPVQIYNDQKSVQKFRMITAPFMMRRLKSDKNIISDLPDKIEKNEYANLSTYQAALYHQTLETAMSEIEGIEGSDHQSLFKRQGLVLQMILVLKQICNHPAQFLKNGSFDVSQSGKTEMLLDLLETILDRNEKVLVFTQFKSMGDILQHILEEKFGEKPLFYHGGCNLKERQNMIDRFQNDRADKIFILSLKAAGTGLNLTAASHVIHYDLWWNPAVESQATDRAYRIGQSKNVFVHRFITKETFEERIDEMIQTKKSLADMTVPAGENWIGKLNNKELREIFG